MNYRRIVPNSISGLSLVFGVISIFLSMEKNFFWAGVLIVLAVAADSCDGRAARLLHCSGDFGIQLDDGTSQLSLMRLSESNRHEWQVTMSEGRNRQIRRTFLALGYTVKKLHRVQFGNYALGDMKEGELESVDMR